MIYSLGTAWQPAKIVSDASRPTRQAVGPWWSRQIHVSRLDLTAAFLASPDFNFRGGIQLGS
ncbi:hypothetical protein N7486_001153 [Penicillium sp. IBT 16267x]|nr:hypothetical protein N7486_001153 [Penicillium sp. IBT 16267x]